MPNLPNQKWDWSISSITFLWVGLFGWREWLKRIPITFRNLPDLPSEFDTEHLYRRFSHYWRMELSRIDSGRHPRLWMCLYLIFRYTLIFLVFSSFFYILFLFGSFLVLIWLIQALETGTYSTWYLVGITLLVCLCNLSLRFLGHMFEYGFSVIGLKYRNILTTAIYHKLLSMSLSQTQSLSSGNILTIITSDLFKFDEYSNQIIFILITPIAICVVTCLAVREVGWIAVLIFVFFILHLIIQFGLASVISVSYEKSLNWTDERNKHLREFLEGIRLIKCFAWEYIVEKSIKKMRKYEFLIILANSFLKSLTSSLATSFPLFYISLVCFSVYASIGGEFTSSRVFGFLAYIQLYIIVFYQLNVGVVGVSELRISINRVQTLLQAPTRVNTVSTSSNVLESRIRVCELSAGITNDNITQPLISDVSLELKAGEILSIVGKVGSGKSSFLLSLINEIDTISGGFEVLGSCAFVAQEPWIISTTIRDNITYGKRWDEAWYEKVVSSCCLDLDISQLPDKDLTIVGDRGITLSGGQKARINLARAVYADADVYLLDDPLSSVDVSVAARLLNIFTNGILSGKTIVLATHQFQFVKYTDKVLLLESGNLVACDSYSAVRDKPEFTQFTQINQIQSLESFEYPELKNEASNVLIESTCTEKNKHLFNSPYSEYISPSDANNNVNEEITHSNGLSLVLYFRYFWFGGNVLGILSILFLNIATFFGMILGHNYYLIWWIEANTESVIVNTSNISSPLNPLINVSLDTRIYLFIGLCVILSLLLFASSIVDTWVTTRASHNLHNRMLWRVLRAPSTFFFKNSIGSIMNRFSKDIATMDYLLPRFYSIYIFTMFYLLFTFIATVIAHWLTVAPCILLIGFLILYRFQLVRTIRQLKRLESAAKSDVIAHVSSTLHGLATIHSLSLESHQIVKMQTHQDTHLKCWRVFYGYLRFFAFQVDSLIAIYSLLVAIVLILLRDSISSSVSAFILLQVLTLFGRTQFALRISAEVEMNMVSVERVLDYIELPQEAPLHSNGPDFHVTRGEIEFKDVQMKYSPELPLVLKGVSFKVRSGEKVGIVGRTGAGKSSLQNALLRLIELTSGHIYIDGVDITELGLHDLRNQVSIIPQDPVLFSGPIRFALDPFSLFEDCQLWQVLEEVELGEKVRGLEGQLEFIVSEGGSNFSVGEKQLLCLARAILKQTKILMLDEATSYVDTVTDSRIQRLLQSKFKNSTVLTIAHRIQTVRNYDEILVMGNGEVINRGSPDTLFSVH